MPDAGSFHSSATAQLRTVNGHTFDVAVRPGWDRKNGTYCPALL